MVINTMVIDVKCVLDINVMDIISMEVIAMSIYVLDINVMDIISVLYCIVQLELKRLVY